MVCGKLLRSKHKSKNRLMLTQPSKTKETTSDLDLLVGRRLADLLVDTQAAVALADLLVVDSAGCRKGVELAVHARLASHSQLGC